MVGRVNCPVCGQVMANNDPYIEGVVGKDTYFCWRCTTLIRVTKAICNCNDCLCDRGELEEPYP